MREKGYYWVRWDGQHWTGEPHPEFKQWQVALWSDDRWWLCGSELEEADAYWVEIDERRIER